MTSPNASPFPDGKGKPVCVFCASSPGNDPVYTTSAVALGQALAGADIPVVYGGGRRGIMGVVSQSTLEAGGYVHGVLPKALVTRASEFTERPGSRSSSPAPAAHAVSAEGKGSLLLPVDCNGRLTMEVVGSMHERKTKMAKLSTGGFVVLPGGFGTFEELMEMVTWNQIGMHALPVIVLNVGNFYTPMKGMIENGVKAGFISEKNAQLVQIIDLGSPEDNASDERAAEWGPLAVKTLQEWTFPNGAGYGFKWEDEKTSTAATGASASAAATSSASDVPYLFSTGRYTSPAAERTEINKSHIPLWGYHVARLRRAHAHFAAHDGAWAGTQWVGDDALWAAVRDAVQAREDESRGDWRLRIVLRPAGLEVQVLPAPSGIAPFAPLPPAERAPTRTMYLDTVESPAPAGDAYRTHKTSRREVYDAAGRRGPGAHPEVVLHSGGQLLEGVTSNIAVWRNGEWVTPRAALPILPGAMRANLLDLGVIVEGDVSVNEWEAARDGGRVIAFNALRGVWEAELA